MIIIPPDLFPYYSLWFSIRLFWTLLIRFCRRRQHSLQVHSLLLPPPFSNPYPQHLHRFLSKVQNWPRRNVLYDRILPPRYIHLHLLKPRHLYRLLQYGVPPTLVQKPLRLPPCNLSGLLVIDYPPPPPRSRLMHGVITHISDPKRNIFCTTKFKNIPNTSGLAPSCPSIIDNRSHVFLDFDRFSTIADQSSS